MKKTLLLFCLVLFCYAPMLAQSLTGDQNPCPSTVVIYRVVAPSAYGTPYWDVAASSNVVRADLAGKNQNSDGTNTFDFNVVWANQPATGTLAFYYQYEPSKKSSISVTIKGIADVGFESYPDPQPCNSRGNVFITATNAAGATSYEWSNDAGWTSNGSATRNAMFTITNSKLANLIVKAVNSSCPGIYKTNSRSVPRTQLTDTAIFSRVVQPVCHLASLDVAVTATGTPIGYQWYTKPAGIAKINGGDYSESSPIQTTTNTVTLTESTTGGTMKLYCRPVYDADCYAPWSSKVYDVGTPVTSAFWMIGSKVLEYGTGLNKPLTTYSVCTREGLVIFPVTNITNTVRTHKWEVVSGSYISIGALDNYNLGVQISATYGTTLKIRYQYQTGCGWSDWTTLTLIAYNCETDPGTGLRVAQVDSTTVEENTNTGFTIAPNPASSNITVTVPVSGNSKGDMLVSVTDIKGSNVLTRKVSTAARFTLDVSTLPSGSYILQVQTGTKKVAKQFIVSK